MVDVAQSVRVVVCGTIGRGFESHLPPQKKPKMQIVCTWASFYLHFLSYLSKSIESTE